MKLLLDENLSQRIVPFIQDIYPESTQVALIGLEQANDKTIRQYAIDNDFVVEANDLNDKSNRADKKHRADKKQGVLLDRLHIALKHLNSKLPDDAINVAIEKLTQSHIQQAAFDANKTVYKLVRGGLEVDVTNSNGRTEKRTVQVLDFANPKNNDFLLVAQI